MNKIKVKVMTAQETLYQGEALSVSSTNTKGKFDILAQHAKFITIIENQTITILLVDNTPKSYNFAQAIIYTQNNQVTIFANPSL